MQGRQGRLLYAPGRIPRMSLSISACFNVALNRCEDVQEVEAKFLFEENLWSEVAI